MEGTLKNGEVFGKIIAAISELVTVANFDCTDSGMSLQAIDDARVTLISMILNAGGFEQWKCDNDCQIGVKMEYLANLKGMDAQDSLEFFCESAGVELACVFKGQSEERVSTFFIPLVDVDGDDNKIEMMDFRASVTMPSADLMTICRDLAPFSDTVFITVTKEEVSFKANGERGTVNMSLKATDEENAQATLIVCEEEMTQEYSLQYLQKITKATPLSKVVSLSFMENCPMLVEYKIDELGHIRYYLAPKVNDEDE